MKLTKKSLLEIIEKSLLLEYPEYFGKKFIEFKQRFEAGEPALLVARDILDQIGAGSTRVVFSFSDNPAYVLKVINTEVPMGKDSEDIHGFTRRHKLQSNQWEADLTMQQLYPDIFPRTFEVADDFTWILSERVTPLKSFQELLNAINLGDEVFGAGRIGKIQFQAIIELAIESLKPGENEAKQMISEIMLMEAFDSDPTLKMNPDRGRSPGMNLFKSRIIKVLSNVHVRKMLRAMGELDIPSREFSAKNLGVSEISGKLMLLDASLWKPHVKLR